MATTTDTDRLLSDCGEDSHQSGNDDVDGCTQMHLVNEQVSPDGHYYTAYVQIVVDLFAVQRLSKLDQYNVLSQYVYNLFASFMDYQRKEDFCLQLVRMFIAGTLEVVATSQQGVFINLPKSTGQAELVRLIISYMSPQKQASIHDSTTFNALKNLLLQHLRKQSLAISVNSMSKTLSRAVEQVLKQLPVNPDSQ